MTAFVKTPYTRSLPPFAIGLKPIEDMSTWLIFDDEYERYHNEKRMLLERDRDQHFCAEDGTVDSQNEVLDLIIEHLNTYHPGTIDISDDDLITILPLGKTLSRQSYAETPLILASLLVQEDLVLMRKRPEGWSLVAAFVAFPSSWDLKEKFTKTLSQIHAPVPGLPGRPSQVIERVFNSLQEDIPVYRQSWSLYDDGVLPHPSAHNERTRNWMRDRQDPEGLLHVRIEHQSLQRLQRSGDILFTVRILIDPLAALREHPDGAHLATHLARQVGELSEAEAEYKGLLGARPAVIETLKKIAAGV